MIHDATLEASLFIGLASEPLRGTPGDDWVMLLPLDPDASARALREALGRRFGVTPAVIVTDSFGRAWRQGTTDVAIGVAGMAPLLDLSGQRDARGEVRDLRNR